VSLVLFREHSGADSRPAMTLIGRLHPPMVRSPIDMVTRRGLGSDYEVLRAVATAQTRPDPSVDLSVGYQVLHIPGQTYPLGMSLEVSGALTSIVRVVAEAGVSLARGTTSSYGRGYATAVRVWRRSSRHRAGWPRRATGSWSEVVCGRMRISPRRPVRHSLRALHRNENHRKWNGSFWRATARSQKKRIAVQPRVQPLVWCAASA